MSCNVSLSWVCWAVSSGSTGAGAISAGSTESEAGLGAVESSEVRSHHQVELY
jgi:hypothetical protein